MRCKFALFLVASWIAMGSPSLATGLEELLGRPFSELMVEVGSLATCNIRPHKLQIPLITQQTVVQSDLHSPVTGNFIVEGKDSVFVHPEISVMDCEIAGTANIVSYSREDKIFRIEVSYLRCKVAAAAGNCLDIDEVTRPYDKQVYAEMKHKDAYLLSTEGSFYSVYKKFQSDPTVAPYIANLDCGFWASSFTFNMPRSSKCIADISFADGVLAATTVLEVTKNGYFSDTLIGHYVGRRSYINIKADQDAIEELMERVSAIVDKEKRDQLSSDAKLRLKENGINELLGQMPTK